mgnify:CR=1 FL=1
MAISRMLLSSTIHRIKWLLTDSGTPGGSITNAQLLADIAQASPIYSIFNRTYADQAAARTAISYSDVLDLWIVRREGNGGLTSYWGVDVDVDGGGLPFLDINQQTAGVVAILYMEYRHSMIR